MRKKLSEQMNGYTLFINEKELGPELAFIKKGFLVRSKREDRLKCFQILSWERSEHPASERPCYFDRISLGTVKYLIGKHRWEG